MNVQGFLASQTAVPWEQDKNKESAVKNNANDLRGASWIMPQTSTCIVKHNKYNNCDNHNIRNTWKNMCFGSEWLQYLFRLCAQHF